MIAWLRGTLRERGLDRIIVEVGGVGYLVWVSMQTLEDLPAPGQIVELFCHTHVREDALQIFGFSKTEEQRVFELLILVSGIGPKLALTTLSGMPVIEIVSAIASGDHRKLQTIPGIGKKTAERMVVELKDRCAAMAKEFSSIPDVSRSTSQEVVEALVGLGYKRALAEKAAARVAESRDGTESLEHRLRKALSIIREL